MTESTRIIITTPGDHTEPPVRSVGWLAYDDRYFYAAFDFDDSNPRAIRSPYAITTISAATTPTTAG